MKEAQVFKLMRKFFKTQNCKTQHQLLKRIPHHIGYVNFFKGGEKIA